MARPTHGHPATPDAQRRARLELRPSSRIRERDLAEIVGVRRPVHAGGGCRRRIGRWAQRVGDHGGDRQSRHEIADRTVRCTNAALSPAGYHAHLRARQAERGRRSQADRAAARRIFSRPVRARRGRDLRAAVGLAWRLWRGAGQSARRAGLGLLAGWRCTARHRADGGGGHALDPSFAVRGVSRARQNGTWPRSETTATSACACSSWRRSAGR